MTSLLAVLFVLSLIAVEAAVDSPKEQQKQLPPPTGLKRNWWDAITVDISWEKPHNFSAEAGIYYKYKIADKEGTINTSKGGHCTQNLFTREMDSDHWKFQVWTRSYNNRWRESTPATLNISHDKQKAELVKDFKCVMDMEKLNCSWIPTNPYLNLTVSYRMCGTNGKNWAACTQPNITGNPERHRCILQCNKHIEDTCVSVETDSAVSTFKPQLVINPPLVKVTEENNNLTVTLTPPLPDKVRCMTYQVCFKRCNEPQDCRNTAKGVVSMNFPYDRRCRYEFQAKTNFQDSCIKPAPIGEMSSAVTIGRNESPFSTLAIVAIFITIVLPGFIILLCYCFRKHRDIFWPNIPDPSVIFKQMVNRNNNLKTPGGNLYAPVPEPICPLQIDTPI